MRYLLASIIFVASVLMASLACADGALAYYEVIYRPDQPDNLELTFVYDGRPPKTQGFKFVGETKVETYSASDEDGKSVSISQEAGFRNKLQWRVPAPNPETGEQTVIVYLSQAQEHRHRWTGRTITIPWAHNFSIPVEQMTFIIESAEETLVLPGYECGPLDGKPGTRCSKNANSAFEIHNEPLGGNRHALGIVVLLLSLGVFGFAGATLLRKNHRQLVMDRGRLPSREEAYPDLSRHYQAPAPLPKASEAEPVLDVEDQSYFTWRAVLAAGLWLLPPIVAAFLLNGRSVMPMSMAVAIMVAASGAAMLGYLASVDHSAATLGLGGIGTVIVGSMLAGVGFIVSAVLVGGTLLMLGGLRRRHSIMGGTMDAWTSNCSSSCGSSCGGCGG